MTWADILEPYHWFLIQSLRGLQYWRHVAGDVAITSEEHGIMYSYLWTGQTYIDAPMHTKEFIHKYMVQQNEGGF